MNIIVCVDDKFGMAFGGRRQSRDRRMIEQMLKTVGDNKLYINNYTEQLFNVLPDNVLITNDFYNLNKEDYCFVENRQPDELVKIADKIILYRWNRVYPSDIRFPVETLEGKTKVSSFDFKGYSHEIITEEIYE